MIIMLPGWKKPVCQGMELPGFAVDFLAIYFPGQLIPGNSVFYREMVCRCLQRLWGEEQEMLLVFRGVADMQKRKKAIECPFRKLSFYLQFRKITVYSLCHRSVAFFLRECCKERMILHIWSRNFAAGLRGMSVRQNMQGVK